jgi:hypothetical protein
VFGRVGKSCGTLTCRTSDFGKPESPLRVGLRQSALRTHRRKAAIRFRRPRTASRQPALSTHCSRSSQYYLMGSFQHRTVVEAGI